MCMPCGLYFNIYTGFDDHCLTVNVDLLLVPVMVLRSVQIVPVMKIDRYTPTQSGALQMLLMGIMILMPSYLGANSNSPFSTRVTVFLAHRCRLLTLKQLCLSGVCQWHNLLSEIFFLPHSLRGFMYFEVAE